MLTGKNSEMSRCPVEGKPEPTLRHTRLTSLDVFRGFAIILMILVNNPGGREYYGFLQHSPWNGWTLADLGFPFFIFILGAAIPYSLSGRLERGETKTELLARITRRSLILFVLGLAVNAFFAWCKYFPNFDLTTLRVMGPLQRIALCYLFASIIFLYFKPKWRVFLTIAILLVYWVLMVVVPVPGYGAGILGQNGNLAGHIDKLVLQGHSYDVSWGDPEGLLSTLPAIATATMGLLAGQLLKSRSKPYEKAANLFFFGSLSILLGSVWSYWFPINKNLWTSSFVAFTGGLSLVLLAACFFVIEARGHNGWTKPFIVLGMNSIFIYVMSEIVNITLIFAKIPSLGIKDSMKTSIFETFFAPWVGQLHGSFVYALAYLTLFWLVAALMFKKHLFLKV